jgi:hypothetical protein
MSITLHVYVFIALGVQHAMRMLLIVICGPPCSKIFFISLSPNSFQFKRIYTRLHYKYHVYTRTLLWKRFSASYFCCTFLFFSARLAEHEICSNSKATSFVNWKPFTVTRNIVFLVYRVSLLTCLYHTPLLGRVVWQNTSLFTEVTKIQLAGSFFSVWRGCSHI